MSFFILKLNLVIIKFDLVIIKLNVAILKLNFTMLAMLFGKSIYVTYMVYLLGILIHTHF